ncbi:hypothetical protein [Mycoplasma zalophidermidis]|uniref:Uncharacterized protein n=1 Tax=Mycoplasma zalophidermidis TaxID=398174 RepID=A0ABS6DTA5_9MOLU|nr:hypothetical protein [Mycoplasma zalophidermidis]MBU4690001.1 hypothetical protein [Mycoplasma zalophidermidis]MBU4693845.1 hypothetical protein [Mycoplasma zalophidermidis]MCR8966848.1 hypothetical protein [Mycoplasma zalophidermidis]
MKKINIKTRTIIWLLAGIVSLAIIIVCSLIIHRVTHGVEAIRHINLETELAGEYRAHKAYAIGILSFCSVICAISISICYLGFKSWNYNATL